MKLGILSVGILVLVVAAIWKSIALACIGGLFLGLLFYLRKKTPH